MDAPANVRMGDGAPATNGKVASIPSLYNPIRRIAVSPTRPFAIRPAREKKDAATGHLRHM